MPWLGRRPRTRSGGVPVWLLAWVLVGVLLGSGLLGSAVTAPTAGTSPRALLPATTSLPAARPIGVPTAVRSAGGPSSNASLEFYQNDSSFAVAPLRHQGCTTYNYGYEVENYCYPQSVSPSVVTLANGDIGVGYSLSTNLTGTPPAGCWRGPDPVRERVGFSISSDDGASFGPIDFLGNRTCQYLDAIEPSFAVGPTGTVYGAYVEENASVNQGEFGGESSAYNRSTDALGFTVSTDNGTSFSLPVTINSSGWIAKPQVAVYGQSVYILFENISNSTTKIPYGYSYFLDRPIALHVLYSPNGGVSWNGPYEIRGVSGSSGIVQETGGYLAINRTGAVAVSLFTNETCPENVTYSTSYSYCYHYGDDLEVETSLTNGSTFPLPTEIARAQGSTDSYLPYYYDSGFQQLPESALAFSADGTTLYVGWTSSYNTTDLFHEAWYIGSGYDDGGAFAGSGPSAGGPWTTTIVDASSETYDDMWAYSPALGVSNGTVFFTYTVANSSYCYSGCSYLGGSFYQAVHTSPNGLNWSPASYPTFEKIGYGIYSTSSSFPGLSSSLGFEANGAPILAYSIPEVAQSSENYSTTPVYYNTTYPTALYVATPYEGPTVSLNVTESGAVGAWSFTLGGALWSQAAGTRSVTVPGVAANQTILISAPAYSALYGSREIPQIAIGGGASFDGAAEFDTNGSVFVNYTEEYGLTINVQPANPYQATASAYDSLSGTYYSYTWGYYACPTCGDPFPWYFTANASFVLNFYGDPTGVSYWAGTGPGNYTGTTPSPTMALEGPVNETAWMTPFAYYNLSVDAAGPPAGQTFHFDFDGTPYSAAVGQSVEVPEVLTGSHDVSDVWATSSTPGWEYIGTAEDSSPWLVPVEINATLTFVLVDMGAPNGTIRFDSTGFPAGTPWSLSFNGTRYSATVPWLNVSTRPGTFPVSGYPAVASNGSVGYTPAGFGPSLSVLPGGNYSVNFSVADRLAIVVGSGGTVGGSMSSTTIWTSPGSVEPLAASPKVGYSFGGWSGEGLGSYTGPSPDANVTVGGPVSEAASFLPLPTDRFNLTFLETGLAPGTWWSVYLDGEGYSTNSSALVIGGLPPCGLPGSVFSLGVPYAYGTPNETRYLPTSNLPSQLCTSGSTTEAELFASQYFLTLQSTAGGFVQAIVGTTSTSSGMWVARGQTVSLDATAQVGYDFLGWNGTGAGNYTGTAPVETIVPAGPLLEVGAFGIPQIPPPPSYWVEFTESALLVPGTAWTVELGASGYTSTGTSLFVMGIAPGHYSVTALAAYAPDGSTRYSPSGDPSSLTISKNTTVPLGFLTAFWLSVSGSPGGTVGPSSGWVSSGTTEQLSAVPSTGFEFVEWQGTGPAAYAGSNSTGLVRITGATSEVATFAVLSSQGGTETSSGPIWSGPTGWAVFAVIGLVAGIAIGVVLWNRRREPPVPMEEAQPPIALEPENLYDESTNESPESAP
jgi:hypothetical protein